MWVVYFSVDDVDAAVATATRLGAQVLSEPTDTPIGRLATLRDPDGARFCLAVSRSPEADAPGRSRRHARHRFVAEAALTVA
jgi:hypothetical protein